MSRFPLAVGVAAGLTALALSVPGCAKKLPSGPGSPAGAPVILNYTATPNGSREFTISGTVKNKTGFTIYDVRVAMTVYLGDPVFANVTDTSDKPIPVLENDSLKAFAPLRMSGDRFVDAEAVWSYLPPSRTGASADSLR